MSIWLLQVNGFAAQYEATGDKDALTAVQHFFYVITHHHSYATGGQPSHTHGLIWYCCLLLHVTCTQIPTQTPTCGRVTVSHIMHALEHANALL
jgi:hypothetical protein